MSVCDTDKNVEESSFMPTTMFFGKRVLRFLLAFINASMKRIRVYRNCEENRITWSLFRFYVERRWICVASDAPQWQMHRGRLLYSYAKWWVRDAANVSAIGLFESSNKNGVQQNPSENCSNLIYGHFCVWVNKINKHKTENGPFAIAIWWKK